MRIILPLTVCTILLFGLAGFQSQPLPDDYEKAWQQIDSLIRHGNLRSAYTLVQRLESRAWQENNQPQWVKTIQYRCRLERDLNDDELRTALTTLYSAVERAPRPARAVLQTMLAGELRTWLQGNAWQLGQRTHNPDIDSLAPSTWTITWIVTQINDLLEAALTTEDLARAHTADWLPVCRGPEETIDLRPTLLDLVAARATRIWLDLEDFVPHPPEPFELTGEALFADVPRFVQLKLEQTDAQSPLRHAVQAFQVWLRTRMQEPLFAALLDADLHRLDFMYRHATTPGKDSLYLAALDRWEARCFGQRPVAEVWAAKARFFYSRGDARRIAEPDPWARAVAICRKAEEKFPDTWGAGVCRQIRTEIQQPVLDAALDKVLLPDEHALLRLEWRNIRSVRVRIVRLDAERAARWHDWKNGAHSEREKALAWLEGLPATQQSEWTLDGWQDWRRHTTEVPLDPLPSGKYLLLVQAEHAYSSAKADYVQELQVSHITWLKWQHPYQRDQIYVLHRKEGHPLSDARLEVWSTTWQRHRWSKEQLEHSLNPDKYGAIALPDLERSGKRYTFRFIRGNDTLETTHSGLLWEQEWRPDSRPTRTALILLDRPIYRPGQMVHFKIIALERSADRQPRILPDQEVQITLEDANHQEVGTLDLRTNAFGSAAGSFVLPEGKLTGLWVLRTNLGGSRQGFPVEAYKRPRFETRIELPQSAFRLGEEVALTGTARAYGGYPIAGAKVVWQVEQTAEYAGIPWHERVGLPEPTTDRVAQGQTLTDVEGHYAIAFRAAAPPLSDPRTRYRFTITATVTDGTGETHSARRTLTIGREALLIESDLPQAVFAEAWDSIRVSLHNQARQPLAAKATVSLYRLQAPGADLLPRPWPAPDRPLLDSAAFRQMFPRWAWRHEDQPATWPVASRLWQRAARGADLAFATQDGGRPLPAGVYRVVVESTDPFGRPVRMEKHVYVLRPNEKSPLPQPLWSQAVPSRVEVGQEVTLHVATAGDDRPVLAILERGNEVLRKEWVTADRWARIQHLAQPEDRGGLSWTAATIVQNRCYVTRRRIEVPWTDKKLTIRYGQFRDRLKPGQREEWMLRIEGPDGGPAPAEVVATLYDASLEAFATHHWPHSLWPSRHGMSSLEWEGMTLRALRPFRSFPYVPAGPGSRSYPDLTPLDLLGWDVPIYHRMGEVNAEALPAEEAPAFRKAESGQAPPPPPPPPEAGDDAAPEETPTALPPAPRTRLDELVFFEPQLTTDAGGRVTIRFRMNEAITRWKFRALAHTQGLAMGYSEREVVTTKELLIVPNAPRFVREGDRIGFTAKVVNNTDRLRHFNAALQLVNAASGMPVYKWLDNPQFNVEGEVPAHGSKDVQWWFEVPPADEVPLLEYTVEVSSGDLIDAERSVLPVLPDRMLVTEAQPITIGPGADKTVSIGRLAQAPSATMQPFALTLECTPNPAWLAVKALPYLMEYPHACSEQVFSRLYANTLASALAHSQPRIRKVFEQWQQAGAEALESPLTQNEELKAALLAETPWVLDALSETEQRRRIALLFDLHKMAFERDKALGQLRDNQNGDGGWPWFRGGRSSRYITQYIVEGFGHLRKLGAWDPDHDMGAWPMLEAAFQFLDGTLLEEYRELERRVKEGKANWDDDHLSPLAAHYLYARTFFADRWPERKELTRVRDYYLEQARHWWHARTPCLQGMLALALHRTGDEATAHTILQSLRERAIRHDELGMYWKQPAGWWWYQHPIETQSLLIEAFAEIDPKPEEIAAMKTWLLRQKQTQAWPTTKATAEAVYALLAFGNDWLAETGPFEVNVGNPKAFRYPLWNRMVQEAREKAEAGTGHFKVRFDAELIEPELGTLRLHNPNAHTAWAAVYFQYFERLDRIEAHNGGPLQLERQFYRKQATPTGFALVPLDTAAVLHPGDEVVARVVIRTDRDMELVHLKDMRASGLEPVDVRSGYRWQGRLGYYQSTRDEATHFFFDRLPAGTHVLEYSLRAVHRGRFATGISTLQCMYAPEFAGHSQGDVLKVE